MQTLSRQHRLVFQAITYVLCFLLCDTNRNLSNVSQCSCFLFYYFIFILSFLKFYWLSKISDLVLISVMNRKMFVCLFDFGWSIPCNHFLLLLAIHSFMSSLGSHRHWTQCEVASGTDAQATIRPLEKRTQTCKSALPTNPAKKKSFLQIANNAQVFSKRYIFSLQSQLYATQKHADAVLWQVARSWPSTMVAVWNTETLQVPLLQKNHLLTPQPVSNQPFAFPILPHSLT